MDFSSRNIPEEVFPLFLTKYLPNKDIKVFISNDTNLQASKNVVEPVIKKRKHIPKEKYPEAEGLVLDFKLKTEPEQVNLC